MVRLLIVDDEIHSAEGVKCAIDWESIGVTGIFTAYSMAQAQNVVEREQIDLLITDIEMPQGTGFDLLQWIYQRKHVPVTIMLTSYAEFHYAKQAINYQCLDYLLKPVSREQLLETSKRGVEAVMEKRRREPAVPGDMEESTVSRIKKYIKSHIDTELSRGQIAAEFFMSTDYVSRLFRQESGKQMSEYITEVRMEEARYLLETSNLPVGEVAYQAGYNDLAYFSKVFRSRNGMTPAQYRRIEKR
ncbi:MAG: response regulator transcription factor [Lachnospiraceae bacterium]